MKTDILKLNNASENDEMLGAASSDISQSKIEVRSINGVDWDEFVKSVFRKGRSTQINGNIIFTKRATIQNLFTIDLNGKDPDDFLTITTDQIIETNMFLQGMHVPELKCGAINNMPRFAENVALIGENNIINGEIFTFIIIITHFYLDVFIFNSSSTSSYSGLQYK